MSTSNPIGGAAAAADAPPHQDDIIVAAGGGGGGSSIEQLAHQLALTWAGVQPQPQQQPPSDASLPAGPPADIPMTTASDDSRYCWVCFATDEDDELAEWVQPCNCLGTIRWVHQSCLQRWVDEKQKGNSMRRVACPQCQTEYIIVFPAMGTVIAIMEGIDALLKRLSPFLAAGIMVGSLYWTAVTYGAVTVMQVVGHEDGLEMMEKADPLVLLIGLPAIPVGLVLGRMVRWEDMILRVIQNRQGLARKFPLLSLILPLP